MMARLPLIGVLVVVLAGCAAAPRLTRDEWLAMQTRTYPGVTSAQVYAAAERLFVLADERDVQIAHTQDRMMVARRWVIFLVIAAASGTDYWTVRATDTPAGAVATVEIATSQHGAMGLAGMPTTGGGMAIGTMTSPGTGASMPGSPALYDLFWARMDYLLGRTTNWRTCDQQADRVDRAETRGILDPLCSITLTDALPPGYRDDTPAKPAVPMQAPQGR